MKTVFFMIFPFLEKKAEWEGDKLSTDTFKSLHLSRADVIKLHKLYREVDEDDGGTIDVKEFLNFVDTPITPFSKRVFSIMDEDGNGKLDFREFVIACWNYCSFGKRGLILFAYDLYDADSNGTMSAR